MDVFTDAGFAGPDTDSQSGLVDLWAGSLSTWRSSRASLSALSTAEEELCAELQLPCYQGHLLG